MSKFEEFKAKMLEQNPEAYLEDIEEAWNKQNKGQSNKPKSELDFKDDKQVKTTMTDMYTLIKEKLSQISDLATMEVLLEVNTRMKHRLESIKKMSSANHIKVRGHWKTIAPQMQITALEGKKVSNDEVEISFSIYDTNEKGKKKLFSHFAEVTNNRGETFKRETAAEYRIKYEVVEKIKTGKAITREVIRVDRIQEN
jgi:hypothetical protein